MKILKILIGVVVAGAAATALLYLALTSEWAADRVRLRMVAFLEDRFDADVEIGEITIALVPKVAIEGRRMTLTRVNGSRVPFIRLDNFSVGGWPLDLLRRHLSDVTVDGFELRVERGVRRAPGTPSMTRHDVTIDRVVVRNGLLLIVPNNPEKLPLQFDLQEVVMEDFGFDRSSPYRARLTNPKPRGSIDSTGRFGPWVTDNLRLTPLSGGYTFDNADLSTIKGIGGTLTSTGKFDGILERVHVRGVTSTPDFHLDLTGQPVALNTRFDAVVDGTTGDTALQEVDATLGQSRIVAKGLVAGQPGAKGRTIALAVKIDEGKFEDFMTLTVKAAEPPMRGQLGVDATFDLPPGEADVPQRLQLEGTFRLGQGQFTSDTVQERIDEMSRRGRGQPKNQDVQNVLSTFGGTFRMRDGVLRLPQLQFRVRGAAVDLAGSYRLQQEALDFAGTLKLDASLSQTTTGFKSLLLKAVDPFFRKSGAGAVLPIKVTGTVDQPAFGLDVRRVLSRR
ncbi:MAG: hypothetical protein HOP16_04230 [Acidobacteria bacterium]|nr:hypothetical protein [Acidobacteriota bacterium]